MMNKKGQALVEFIIVFPIILFIFLAIIDYVMMSYNKIKMENIISDVERMYKNNENSEEINDFIKKNDLDISLLVKKEDKYLMLKLEKEYDCLTPGLDKILNASKIKIERNVYYE